MGATILGVDIRGGASPEGRLETNRKLARDRSNNTKSEVQRLTGLADSMFRIESAGVDWDGLYELVSASNMPYRDDVLEIILTTPEQIFDKSGKWTDGRRRRLEMLSNGAPWKDMMKRFFPLLRSSRVSINSSNPKLSTGVFNAQNDFISTDAGKDKEGESQAPKYMIGANDYPPPLGDLYSDEVIDLIDSYRRQGIPIEEIDIRGGSNPEGKLEMNYALAVNRASNTKNQIQGFTGLPDDHIITDRAGIDWAGVRKMVEDSDMDHRDAVLNIIDSIPEQIFDDNGKVIDGRTQQLMKLLDGKPWDEMRSRFFPQLNRSRVSIKTPDPEKCTGIYRKDIPKPVEPVEPDTVVVVVPDTIVVPVVDDGMKKPGKVYVGLKTNLLYDAVGLPNLGFELQRGMWSVTASGIYGWWRNWTTSPHLCGAGGEVAVRRWFGQKAREIPLAGHHIGLTGQMVAFDVKGPGRNERYGYYAPFGTLGGGLEYGYGIPLCKGLTLDLSVGAGYVITEMHRYEHIDDCDVKLKTYKYRTVAPVKAEVSLVWTINR